MAANNHPEPQLLSQDTDEQGTVAAPDDSSLIGTEPDEVIGNLKVGSTGSVEGGKTLACLNRPARVGNLETPQVPAQIFRMAPTAALTLAHPARELKRPFSRRRMIIPDNRDAQPEKEGSALSQPARSRTGLQCCRFGIATHTQAPHDRS
jgi:hypothetical protein